MRIIFRQEALKDILWFEDYYSRVFPEGAKLAQAQIKNLYTNLLQHPYMGHPHERYKDVREVHLPKTPFSFIYRVDEEEIIVLRLLDMRAARGDEPYISPFMYMCCDAGWMCFCEILNTPI